MFLRFMEKLGQAAQTPPPDPEFKLATSTPNQPFKSLLRPPRTLSAKIFQSLCFGRAVLDEELYLMYHSVPHVRTKIRHAKWEVITRKTEKSFQSVHLNLKMLNKNIEEQWAVCLTPGKRMSINLHQNNNPNQ